MTDSAMFSRSIHRTSEGKATEEIKIRVSEEIKGELAGLAALHGLTLSEYLREVATEHCRGRLYTIRLRAGAHHPEGRE